MKTLTNLWKIKPQINSATIKGAERKIPFRTNYECNSEFELKLAYNVRFEGFTVVTTKNGVFWDVTPLWLL
jgi:hypothetical protein